jgi:hypothetical protein
MHMWRGHSCRRVGRPKFLRIRDTRVVPIAKPLVAWEQTPFISFKARHRGNGGGTWEKMYHYFQFKRGDFLAHYHKRSNVESTFSTMKRKFGDGLRSKTDVAMANEALCKILCHNLVVLIHEMCELGVDPVFWPKAASV